MSSPPAQVASEGGQAVQPSEPGQNLEASQPKASPPVENSKAIPESVPESQGGGAHEEEKQQKNGESQSIAQNDGKSETSSQSASEAPASEEKTHHHHHHHNKDGEKKDGEKSHHHHKKHSSSQEADPSDDSVSSSAAATDRADGGAASATEKANSPPIISGATIAPKDEKPGDSQPTAAYQPKPKEENSGVVSVIPLAEEPLAKLGQNEMINSGQAEQKNGAASPPQPTEETPKKPLEENAKPGEAETAKSAPTLMKNESALEPNPTDSKPDATQQIEKPAAGISETEKGQIGELKPAENSITSVPSPKPTTEPQAKPTQEEIKQNETIEQKPEEKKSENVLLPQSIEQTKKQGEVEAEKVNHEEPKSNDSIPLQPNEKDQIVGNESVKSQPKTIEEPVKQGSSNPDGSVSNPEPQLKKIDETTKIGDNPVEVQPKEVVAINAANQDPAKPSQQITESQTQNGNEETNSITPKTPILEEPKEIHKDSTPMPAEEQKSIEPPQPKNENKIEVPLPMESVRKEENSKSLVDAPKEKPIITEAAKESPCPEPETTDFHQEKHLNLALSGIQVVDDFVKALGGPLPKDVVSSRDISSNEPQQNEDENLPAQSLSDIEDIPQMSSGRDYHPGELDLDMDIVADLRLSADCYSEEARNPPFKEHHIKIKNQTQTPQKKIRIHVDDTSSLLKRKLIVPDANENLFGSDNEERRPKSDIRKGLTIGCSSPEASKSLSITIESDAPSDRNGIVQGSKRSFSFGSDDSDDDGSSFAPEFARVVHSRVHAKRDYFEDEDSEERSPRKQVDAPPLKNRLFDDDE